jgi:hypothetical protein
MPPQRSDSALSHMLYAQSFANRGSYVPENAALCNTKALWKTRIKGSAFTVNTHQSLTKLPVPSVKHKKIRNNMFKNNTEK